MTRSESWAAAARAVDCQSKRERVSVEYLKSVQCTLSNQLLHTLEVEGLAEATVADWAAAEMVAAKEEDLAEATDRGTLLHGRRR